MGIRYYQLIKMGKMLIPVKLSTPDESLANQIGMEEEQSLKKKIPKKFLFRKGIYK